MHAFFLLTRMVELLLALPLCEKFRGCGTPWELIERFSTFSEIEQIGVFAVSVIVVSAALELVGLRSHEG